MLTSDKPTCEDHKVITANQKRSEPSGCGGLGLPDSMNMYAHRSASTHSLKATGLHLTTSHRSLKYTYLANLSQFIIALIQ